MQSPKILLRRLSVQAIAATLIVSGLVLAATGPTIAQSVDYDQTYGGGTYGEADYGGTAAETAGPTPTPSTSTSPTASPSPTEAPGASGDMPDTGASMELWVAIGAIILATGLGLYGFNHRRRRSAP